MIEHDEDYIDLLSDHLSEDEEKKERLKSWVEGSPDNRKLYEMLDGIELSHEVSVYGKRVRESVRSDVNGRIDKHIRNIRLYRVVLVAAACAAVIFLFVNIFKPSVDILEEKNRLLSQLETGSAGIEEVQIISGTDQKTIENDETITQTEKGDILVGQKEKIEASDISVKHITVVVPKGKRSTINFSDGSVVYINSGTRISYPKTFEGKTRDVFLDGEIYIDVAKDTEKPFLIHTKDMQIKVLGTTFDVSAYSDEGSHSVVLVEGSVVVNSGNDEKTLKPNQGYFNENGVSTVKNVDVYPYICWKNGILKIEGEPFEALLKQLSRYYGTEIILSDNLKNVKFDGSLNLRDSLDDVLRMLSISKPFTYRTQDNCIYIE